MCVGQWVNSMLQGVTYICYMLHIIHPVYRCVLYCVILLQVSGAPGVARGGAGFLIAFKLPLRPRDLPAATWSSRREIWSGVCKNCQ